MSILKVIRNHVFNLTDIENLSYDNHLMIFHVFLKELGFNWISTKRPSVFEYILCFITTFLTGYVIYSEMIFILHNFDDMAKTTECLMTFFLAFALCIKLFLVFFNRNKMKVLIVEMRGAYDKFKLSGGAEWNIMSRRIKEARIVTRVFFYLCV